MRDPFYRGVKKRYGCANAHDADLRSLERLIYCLCLAFDGKVACHLVPDHRGDEYYCFYNTKHPEARAHHEHGQNVKRLTVGDFRSAEHRPFIPEQVGRMFASWFPDRRCSSDFTACIRVPLSSRQP